MMFFKKDDSRPYVAVRCYADVLINRDIADDYFDGKISVRQWLKFSERIDKLEDFIRENVWREDASNNSNIAAGRRVIGYNTATIIQRYAQANFREGSCVIAPSDKAVYINKIISLIMSSKNMNSQYLPVVLDHPEISDSDRKEWTEALNRDIQHIDFGPIREIWLICGDDSLSVIKTVDNFPDISSHALAW